MNRVPPAWSRGRASRLRSLLFFETLTHCRGVEPSLAAEVEQVFLPLWATGALGHAGADEWDDEAAVAARLSSSKRFPFREIVGIENLLLFAEVEAARLLVVEHAVTEIEGAGGVGQRNLFVAALADDLDGLVFLVVDDCVEAGVAADAGDLFDGRLGVKLQRAWRPFR